MFTIDRIMRQGSWLDFGMFLENVMVAARGRGLDTCPQAAFTPLHRLIAAAATSPPPPAGPRGAPPPPAPRAGLGGGPPGARPPGESETPLAPGGEPVASFA